MPIDVYAAAPNRRAVVIHTQNGDSTTAFDGNAGWVAAVEKPVGLLPLNPGGELDGARLDAALAFPGTIKQAFNQWRTGFPLTAIDDRPVQILEGKPATRLETCEVGHGSEVRRAS